MVRDEWDQSALAPSADGEAAAARYSDALERWLRLGGTDFDARRDAVADDLGLTVDLGLPMTALSGGDAARVGLTALLLSRHDLYLLDEPTNDLDAHGLDLLEEFVAQAQTPDRRGLRPERDAAAVEAPARGCDAGRTAHGPRRRAGRRRRS